MAFKRAEYVEGKSFDPSERAFTRRVGTFTRQPDGSWKVDE